MTITFRNDQFKSGEDYYLVTGEAYLTYNNKREELEVVLANITLFKQILDHPETGIFVDPKEFESTIEELAIDKYREL